MKDLLQRPSAVVVPVVSDGSHEVTTIEETVSVEGEIGQPIIKKSRLTTAKISDIGNDNPLPTSEEFSLEGMLASGALLRPVDCEHLLDSPDLLDLQNRGVTGSLFDTLNKFVSDKEKAASLTEKQSAAVAAVESEIVTENVESKE